MRSDLTRSFSEQEMLASTGALAVGTAAGDHVITGLVARGGCGSVYRAQHRLLDREVAIKVLHASLAVQPKMIERFAREVQVVNLLEHPGIITIYDIGSLPDGRPYYTMEYLSGRSLAEILQERGRLPPAEVLEVFEPVCLALQAAHAAGVIHRDVKASNIMVEDGAPPRIKLVDFGIAKLLDPQASSNGLTSEGRQIGTLTIMAPEQLLGGTIDARTDVYALGILLFRVLTGLRPFDGGSPLSLARQHLEEPAPRPSDRAPLPRSLDAIVLRCMEKRPELRYPTMKDLLDALRGALGHGDRPLRHEPHAPTTGVALYLEIHMSTAADELDDALFDDIGAVLDLGEATLRTHGFDLALTTGSQLLGVRRLPSPPAAAREGRADAMAVAASLRRALDERPGADRRVHVNVCVHAGEVVLRAADRPEVIGGALARVDQWAPRERVEGVAATREAIEGFEGSEGTASVVPRAERAENRVSWS